MVTLWLTAATREALSEKTTGAPEGSVVYHGRGRICYVHNQEVMNVNPWLKDGVGEWGDGGLVNPSI